MSDPVFEAGGVTPPHLPLAGAGGHRDFARVDFEGINGFAAKHAGAFAGRFSHDGLMMAAMGGMPRAEMGRQTIKQTRTINAQCLTLNA